ncbi:hypothetical protein S245_070385, partial [Arachis hypogaea]
TGSEDDGLLDLSEDDFFSRGVLVMKQMQMMNGHTKVRASKWVSRSGQIVDASMVKLKQVNGNIPHGNSFIDNICFFIFFKTCDTTARTHCFAMSRRYTLYWIMLLLSKLAFSYYVE